MKTAKKILIFIALLLAAFVSYGQTSDCPAYCLPNTSTFTHTPTGAGVQELNATNRGCLGIEHRSVWLQVNILTGGTMVFRINPNINADDFDFAVWGPTPVCPPTAAPIRCSYAAGGGNTGVGNGALDLSEGVFGDRWVMAMTVLPGESYIILVDNFSVNSGFNLNWNWGAYNTTATFSCTILPIELLTFSGVPSGKTNRLSWSCATETNNDYFTVERSADGIEWIKIGEVDGAGTSSSQTNYNFTDGNPVDGISYYRLTQTDYNGTAETFNIIAVENKRVPRTVMNVYSMMGERIGTKLPHAAGLYIVEYTDGAREKIQVVE